MKFQKTMAFGLAAVMFAAGLAGCKKQGNVETDGKVNISIGNWPDETDPKGQEMLENYRKQMMEKYPDINVIADTYAYDTKTFTMKASANQLPTCFNTWFTEVGKIIKSGYAADITELMEKYGYVDAMNPDLLAMVTDDNGRIYGFPTGCYAQGLSINKAMFKEAGLVNDDGSVKIPNTYQELAEYAQIIKEKTGKAGYAICTTNNCGGWHFLNIAWSYGVEFMKQDENGKWKATFNTPEAVEALQYVKDLKWKYNALPDNSVIDQNEAHKLFATGQVAMIFEGPSGDYSQKYGMDVSNLTVAKMPEGPKGRYSQMGGNLKMFAPNATPDQLDACFKWLELTGTKVKLDDKAIENMKIGLQATLDNNGLVLDRTPFPIWVDKERDAQTREIMEQYTNVDSKDYVSYFDFSDVTLKAEEPVACQQLYAVLDGCIQEVITNENADCAALIETACDNFQVNHLDKE